MRHDLNAGKFGEMHRNVFKFRKMLVGIGLRFENETTPKPDNRKPLSTTFLVFLQVKRQLSLNSRYRGLTAKNLFGKFGNLQTRIW